MGASRMGNKSTIPSKRRRPSIVSRGVPSLPGFVNWAALPRAVRGVCEARQSQEPLFYPESEWLLIKWPRHRVLFHKLTEYDFRGDYK